jgi:hypothetical protein
MFFSSHHWRTHDRCRNQWNQIATRAYTNTGLLARQASNTYSSIASDSAHQLSIFVIWDWYHHVGRFRVTIGSGQTLGDLVNLSFDLQPLCDESEITVRFVVQKRDCLQDSLHANMDSLVGELRRFVRIEMGQESQRNMDEKSKRPSQIFLSSSHP